MAWTRAGDPGLRWLSYYTDNGAYYYYQTTNGTCGNNTCCTAGRGCRPIPGPTPRDATGYQRTLGLLAAEFEARRRASLRAHQGRAQRAAREHPPHLPHRR